MILKFYEDGHLYSSDDEREWESVTTLIGRYESEFDEKRMSVSCSKKKGGKWYGVEPDKILGAWDEENRRSTMEGSKFHEKMERKSVEKGYMIRDGKRYNVHGSIVGEDGGKISRSLELEDGIYPELIVYDEDSLVCGQADRVEVYGGKVYVKDWKTNKEIKEKGFVDWKGDEKMLGGVLSHLPECEYSVYNLQLSMYMYMILKNNPRLKFGGLTISHFSFEKEGANEWGYPLYKKGEDGVNIVSSRRDYNMRYLENEVKSLLENNVYMREMFG